MARFEMHSADMAIMGEKPVSADILFQMGLDSASGRHGDTDLITAHKWFNIAALKGNKDAARYRKEISGEMSPTEIAEAQRSAREWLSTH
ncbi:sel1 repeat family protein [Roseibium aggregatum]|nr:sel1 repeat family protein [Roseibium aggregatum]